MKGAVCSARFVEDASDIVVAPWLPWFALQVKSDFFIVDQAHVASVVARTKERLTESLSAKAAAKKVLGES